LVNVVWGLLRGAQLESVVGVRVITPPSVGIDESPPRVASGPDVSLPPLEPLDPFTPELELPPELPLGENGFGGLEVDDEQLAIG
jgi:hypothetical protein